MAFFREAVIQLLSEAAVCIGYTKRIPQSRSLFPKN